MIDVETAAQRRTRARFDRAAAVLIGAIALLAAVLAVMQTVYGQRQDRGQQEAARLAADVSVRSAASQFATDSALASQQDALLLGIQGTARSLAALQAGDDAASAVGVAEQQASQQLQAALAATAATAEGAPLDAYAAGLLASTTEQLQAEVTEQNRQVDLANEGSTRGDRSVLGLSFLALAGVLTGLAAVLGAGRSGWISLIAAYGITIAAGTMAVAALVVPT